MSKKDQESHRQKWPKKIWGIILALVAVPLAVIGFLIYRWSAAVDSHLDIWQSIALGVVSSIIASAVVLLIQKAFTDNDHEKLTEKLMVIEETLRRQNILYDSGIRSIHPKTYFDEKGKFWIDILDHTENRLDLIGHSLRTWFYPEFRSAFCKKIKAMVEAGREVRIVLSSESSIRLNCIFSANCGRFDRRNLTKPEKTVLDLYQLLQDVDIERRGYLKVYVSDLKKVTYMYIRTDNQSIVSPYIFSPSNNPHAFLLELESESAYAKAFERDFEDRIEGLKRLNLEEDLYLPSFRKVQCITCENRYSGRGWNREHTEKYLFQNGDITLEAGYFEHFWNETFVKTVIELPVSYGCPSKCKFCASANIPDFYPLQAEEMMAVFQTLYDTHWPHKKGPLLVSLTGIGDLAFNIRNVIDFLQQLSDYKDVQVTLSSCFWNRPLLEQVTRLAPLLRIRKLQITFVSDKPDVLRSVIPAYANRLPNITEVINFIKTSDKTYYRINYILIKNVNDAPEDFQRLCDSLITVKDKIVVRISKLNETHATERNSLSRADAGKAEELQKMLSSVGINCYVFCSEKNDNMNCGQLVTEYI